jgi:hypothetical protein
MTHGFGGLTDTATKLDIGGDFDPPVSVRNGPNQCQAMGFQCSICAEGETVATVVAIQRVRTTSLDETYETNATSVTRRRGIGFKAVTIEITNVLTRPTVRTSGLVSIRATDPPTNGITHANVQPGTRPISAL